MTRLQLRRWIPNEVPVPDQAYWGTHTAFKTDVHWPQIFAIHQTIQNFMIEVFLHFRNFSCLNTDRSSFYVIAQNPYHLRKHPAIIAVTWVMTNGLCQIYADAVDKAQTYFNSRTQVPCNTTDSQVLITRQGRIFWDRIGIYKQCQVDKPELFRNRYASARIFTILLYQNFLSWFAPACSRLSWFTCSVNMSQS